MNTIYRFDKAIDISVELDVDRSPALAELRDLLPRSSSDIWRLPSRLEHGLTRTEIRLKHTKRWPDVHTCFVACCWIVSARCADLFVKHAAEDVEVIPLAVTTVPKLRPAPPYYLLNVHRVVDCVNLTASKPVVLSGTPDIDLLSTLSEAEGGEEVFDPARVPKSVRCFSAKHLRGTYITGPLAKALLALRPKCADFVEIRLKRETPAQRKAALARIRREYDEAMKKKPPPAPKVAISELALPEVVAAFFASDVRRDFRNVEVFDADGCSSAMGSLLAWKDLRWPKGHVPVADDGRGGYFAIDTTRTKEGDCPVVYFDHELADVDKKSGAITPNFEACDDTFAAWLKRVKNGSTGLPRRKR
jgi:hypothetical protein